ncbi:hypothetical protein HanIR_Chr12g0590351 [Helianthus annuus]|nr:hypothetical protein HanIR_Chr12g0590351 [Helianthus annuus]
MILVIKHMYTLSIVYDTMITIRGPPTRYITFCHLHMNPSWMSSFLFMNIKESSHHCLHFF